MRLKLLRSICGPYMKYQPIPLLLLASYTRLPCAQKSSILFSFSIRRSPSFHPRSISLIKDMCFKWTLIQTQMSKQSPNLQKLKALHHQKRNKGFLAVVVVENETDDLDVSLIPQSDINYCVDPGALLQKAEEFCRKTRVAASKCKVFVGNISYRLKSRELKEFFGCFGKVICAQIITDRIKKRSRG